MDSANKKDVEELLFKSDVSSYRMSKDTGIGEATLNKYKRGESDVENMTFGNAIKLQNYYSKLKEENELTDKMSREEAFGRAFATLDIISQRCFDNVGVGVRYSHELAIKPMTVYFRAHKHVMEYTNKFKEIELKLLDRINNYIGTMDAEDYNDEPLQPIYLIYISKESVKLRKLIENNQLLQEEEGP